MNVFVIDAHPIFRRGVVSSLRPLPGVTAVHEAATIDAARGHAALGDADVVIVDAGPTATHELIRDLTASRPVRAIVCWSGCSERDVLAAIRAGAAGVLHKETLTPELLAGTVRSRAEGAAVLAPELLDRLLGGPSPPGEPAPVLQALTARERRVLSLIADGRGTRDVARELSYSERTVKNVLHDASTKLNARSRAHAVAHAVRQNLI